MKPELIVAFIALSGSLVSALITVLLSTKTQREIAETNLRFQQMQLATEHRRNILIHADEQSVPIENALTSAWRYTQELKDLVSNLLTPLGYRLDVAKIQITELAQTIEKHYQENGSHLPEDARNAFHGVKLVAITLRDNIGGSTIVTSDQFDSDMTMILNHSRRWLTDRQFTLLNSKSLLRSNLIDGIRKVL